MTKRKLLLFLAIPVFFTYTVAAQDKWDLKRCVEYAVANNISVKQADVQARLAKLTLDQSRLSQIPTLTAGVSAGINSGRFQNPTTYVLETQTTFQSGLSVQSNVTLFNGFYLQRTIDANRYNWQALLANTDLLKNNITLNVANAYLTVLLANQTAEAALLQLHLSQNQLELTHKQVVAGTLPELNAAELESQVAQDSSTYITDKGAVAQDVLQLKAYMALDASTPFEVDTPPVDQIPIEQLANLQPDAVYALALTNQPQQKMDALQIQSYQELVRATKGAMYPVVSLYGALSSYYLNTPGEAAVIYGTSVDTVGKVVGSGTPVTNPVPLYKIVETKAPGYFTQLNNYFAQQVGINVSIPILNGGILRTNYARSKLNLRNQELQREGDNLTLKNNIYQAYQLAVSALEKFEAQKVTLAQTQKSFDYAQKRYNVGMSNTIDLLTNQNNYFNAKVNLLYDQYDYVFKMKVLEYYKGMGIRL
ncbi:MAG TPA: TolC family protein [Puia sp.]|nr:TolC family protein [Puia sp.]